jgi:hypothetical protein
MKAIFSYPNSDNLAVSKIFRRVALGNERATIHHTLRDGMPMIYWFSIFHHDTSFIDFDVREFWAVVGLPEMKNWMCISDSARLDTLSSLAVSVFEGGFNIVEIAKENNKKMFASQAAFLEDLLPEYATPTVNHPTEQQGKN